MDQRALWSGVGNAREKTERIVGNARENTRAQAGECSWENPPFTWGMLVRKPPASVGNPREN